MGLIEAYPACISVLEACHEMDRRHRSEGAYTYRL